MERLAHTARTSRTLRKLVSCTIPHLFITRTVVNVCPVDILARASRQGLDSSAHLEMPLGPPVSQY